MNKQSSLPREKRREPVPSEHNCEWCPATATTVKEIRHKLGKGTIPTGMFLFSCHEHIATLNRAITARQAEALRR